jgi:hypothetical protein
MQDLPTSKLKTLDSSGSSSSSSTCPDLLPCLLRAGCGCGCAAGASPQHRGALQARPGQSAGHMHRGGLSSMPHRVSRCKLSCVNSAALLLVGVSSVALLQPANREEALHAACRPLQASKAQQTAQFLMRAGFAGHSFCGSKNGLIHSTWVLSECEEYLCVYATVCTSALVLGMSVKANDCPPPPHHHTVNCHIG